MTVRSGASMLFAFAVIAIAIPARALTFEHRAIEAKAAAYAIEAVYPHTGIATIDAEIEAWLKPRVEAFQRDAAPQALSTDAWTLDVDYTVARNDATMLSLLFTIIEFSGGAHPNRAFHTFNFALPDGRPIDLEQVLQGSDGLERVSTLVIADLDRRLLEEGYTDAPWIRRGAEPRWWRFEHFLLLDDALEIEFAPYDVAAYVAGPQQVRLQWSALHGATRADWDGVVASFDCTKAASTVERDICADALIARLDRTLARAYGRRIDANGPTIARALRAAQRAWLAQRDVQCAGEAVVRRTCLAAAYRARLVEVVGGP